MDERQPIVEYDSSTGEAEPWIHFIEVSGKHIRKFIKGGKYFVYGLKLTKQNVPGYRYFQAPDYESAIRTFAPKTQPYKMQYMGRDPLYKAFEFNIIHTDKPTGETVWLMSQAEEEKMQILEKYFRKIRRK